MVTSAEVMRRSRRTRLELFGTIMQDNRILGEGGRDVRAGDPKRPPQKRAGKYFRFIFILVACCFFGRDFSPQSWAFASMPKLQIWSFGQDYFELGLVAQGLVHLVCRFLVSLRIRYRSTKWNASD